MAADSDANIASELERALTSTSTAPAGKRAGIKRKDAPGGASGSSMGEEGWNIDYQIGEELLVHSKFGWEKAKIVKEEPGKHPDREWQDVKCYLIHYPGWGKRYDEWVMKDSMMKLSTVNMEKAAKENEERKVGPQTKKMRTAPIRRKPAPKPAAAAQPKLSMPPVEPKSAKSVSVRSVRGKAPQNPAGKPKPAAQPKQRAASVPNSKKRTVPAPAARSNTRAQNRNPSVGRVSAQPEVSASEAPTKVPRAKSRAQTKKPVLQSEPEKPQIGQGDAIVSGFNTNDDVMSVRHGQLRKGKIVETEVVVRYLVRYTGAPKIEDSWVTGDALMAAGTATTSGGRPAAKK